MGSGDADASVTGLTSRDFFLVEADASVSKTVGADFRFLASEFCCFDFDAFGVTLLGLNFSAAAGFLVTSGLSSSSLVDEDFLFLYSGPLSLLELDDSRFTTWTIFFGEELFLAFLTGADGGGGVSCVTMA